MKLIDQALNTLLLMIQKVRTWPFLGRTSFVVGLALMLLAWTQGHHLDHPSDVPGYASEQGVLKPLPGVAPPSRLLQQVASLLPYLDRWMLIGGAVYLFVMFRHWPDARKMQFPTWVAAISVALWAIATDLVQQLGNMQLTEMGEPPAIGAYTIKLVLIAVAMLMVPVMLRYYVRCGALDKYTLRTFLQPLLFCFIAFCSLFIIMDLLDNLKDFQEAKSGVGKVISFYLGLIPFIFVSVMPASLLLSVLYALTKMSRANEIVAMLTAGRSVNQILRPVFIVVVAVCAWSVTGNYYWAPRAEGNRKAVIRALSAGQQGTIMESSVMSRDAVTGRIWFASSFPFSLRDGGDRLRGVQVQEFDAATGKVKRTIHAESAMWWPNHIWNFYDGKEMLYENGESAGFRAFPDAGGGHTMLEVKDFSETPWSMISSSLMPDYMGVPELVSYLQAHAKDPEIKLAPFRTHLYHRVAMPWQSLALALVAAPLGIAFSRRGSIGGIAGSIFIFFALLFLNQFFLNLGKGNHLAPWLSPWMPHLLFGSLGLVLMHYRSQNKDLPKISISRLLGRKAKVVRSRRAMAAASQA